MPIYKYLWCDIEVVRRTTLLQCVAQCVAVLQYSVLQCVAVLQYSVLQCVVVLQYCVLQCVAVCCSVAVQWFE